MLRRTISMSYTAFNVYCGQIVIISLDRPRRHFAAKLHRRDHVGRSPGASMAWFVHSGWRWRRRLRERPVPTCHTAGISELDGYIGSSAVGESGLVCLMD